MSQGFGHNSWLGFGEEVTYGTGVATTDYLEILSETFKADYGFISKPSLRSPSQKNRVPKKKGVSGGFKFQFPIVGAEVLLKHALGAVATTGAGPTYDHAYTLSSLPVGLTFAVNRDADNIGGSSAFRYEGCQIKKLTLSQEIEDFLMCDIEIIGEDSALIAKPTPSFPAFDGMDWSHVTVARIDVAGTPINPNVRKIELSIENSLAEDRYKLGQRTRTGLGRSAHRIITGYMEIEFDSLDAYNKYFNETDEDLQFKWVSGSNSLTFNIPKASFTGEDPSFDGPGEIVFPMSFELYSTGTDNDELTATLTNTTAII